MRLGKMNTIKCIIVLLSLSWISTSPVSAGNFDKLAFLQGHWQSSNDGFFFEEIWTGAAGGVMTAMARGTHNHNLAVLEYILITQEENEFVMRFKHFNADYSNWDGEKEPITLRLTELSANNAVFTTDDKNAKVTSIRYFINDEQQLVAEIGTVENGKANNFTLTMDRAVE